MVIDPRPSVQALGANYWLPVRPGTDGVLALGLAHLMIHSAGYDEGFVREWTNAPILVREDTGLFLRLDELDGGKQADCYCIWDVERRATVAYDRTRPGPRSAAIKMSHLSPILCDEMKSRSEPQERTQVLALDHTLHCDSAGTRGDARRGSA